jgi:hypothetical protein
MDKLTFQRQLILTILSEYAEYLSGDPNSEPLLVVDDRHDHFLILFSGWNGNQRELKIHVYVRLRNGKFWIEEDGTEFGIARRLLEGGVPKSEIVLAFQTPAERLHTEFAYA